MKIYVLVICVFLSGLMFGQRIDTLNIVNGPHTTSENYVLVFESTPNDYFRKYAKSMFDVEELQFLKQNGFVSFHLLIDLKNNNELVEIFSPDNDSLSTPLLKKFHCIFLRHISFKVVKIIPDEMDYHYLYLISSIDLASKK
jgi:thioredoxin-related protein